MSFLGLNDQSQQGGFLYSPPGGGQDFAPPPQNNFWQDTTAQLTGSQGQTQGQAQNQMQQQASPNQNAYRQQTAEGQNAGAMAKLNMDQAWHTLREAPHADAERRRRQAAAAQYQQQSSPIDMSSVGLNGYNSDGSGQNSGMNDWQQMQKEIYG